MSDLSTFVSPFEVIRRVGESGSEFWFARELMPLLGYKKYERFEDAIERAKAACQNAGNSVPEHFFPEPGSYKGRPKEDYRLSRYASYLVAMNGDPRKPEVAAAQAYFAAKTREAELQQRPLTQMEMVAIQAQKMVEMERRQLEQEQQQRQLQAVTDDHDHRLTVVEAELERYEHPTGQYYPILAHARTLKMKLGHGDALRLGKAAAKLCAERGIAVGKVKDFRYGEVNSYPVDILDEVFGLVKA